MMLNQHGNDSRGTGLLDYIIAAYPTPHICTTVRGEGPGCSMLGKKQVEELPATPLGHLFLSRSKNDVFSAFLNIFTSQIGSSRPF